MTSYFRGTVDFLMAGTRSGPDQGYSKSILFFDVLTPWICLNLINFYFFMHENGLFKEGGWQVGKANIDHIDFALIFFVSFITYQNRNIVCFLRLTEERGVCF